MMRRAGVLTRHARRLALTGGAAAMLCGCVATPELADESGFAPGSPLVAAIAKAKAQPGPYPKFTEIPQAPSDLKPQTYWDQSTAALQGSASELAQAVAAPPEMPDPGAWAQQTLSASGLDRLQAPGAETGAEIEAYARELRERATPPPPPQ